MLWILTAVTAFAGIVALVVLMFVKRAANVNELGCVSNNWISEHHVDWL
jgi:hypothetical protein